MNDDFKTRHKEEFDYLHRYGRSDDDFASLIQAINKLLRLTQENNAIMMRINDNLHKIVMNTTDRTY
jgi:hypothetical protein